MFNIISFFKDLKTAFFEVKDKYLIPLLTFSGTIAVLITGSFTSKLLGTTYDMGFVTWLLFYFFATWIATLILLYIGVFIHYYRVKFNPIKIIDNTYQLIIRLFKKESSDEEKSIITETFQILVNDETTARYTFILKISESVKRKFEGKNKHSRFSVIIRKPSTVSLSPWNLKSKWDQKIGKSPDEQLFCLDQKYEGSSTRLKFDLKVNSESLDENSKLEIWFEYGSMLEDVNKGNYNPPTNNLHCEKLHYVNVKVVEN